MDLLPRCAQLSRFDIVEVGLKRGFGFLQRAAKRLVRGVERLAQFLLNPGQALTSSRVSCGLSIRCSVR
ncbi:hypothetical protein [Methylibium sp. T29]|uniref:hypothetical protein n=1 Tax=Methylibium sp. T29 TaxID=1430884 RepID=UPI00156531FD